MILNIIIDRLTIITHSDNNLISLSNYIETISNERIYSNLIQPQINNYFLIKKLIYLLNIIIIILYTIDITSVIRSNDKP